MSDPLPAVDATTQLLNNIGINIICFVSALLFFEFCRGIRPIYLPRLSERFQGRVPEAPSSYLFGWFQIIHEVSENDLLSMVGLDGYMLLRFIIICFRIACFCAAWGMCILVPIYYHSENGLHGWDKYTIANLHPESIHIWAPVIFCYMFAIFFCQLMYYEYKFFIEKRLHYLVHGDLDTPVQTYYTVMVEKIPKLINSGPSLANFFEQLFPGDVYSVELALDLHELESLVQERKQIKHLADKCVIKFKTSKRRKQIWIPSNFYEDMPDISPTPIRRNYHVQAMLGCISVDALQHYAVLLSLLNSKIKTLQAVYFEQRQKQDAMEQYRMDQVKQMLTMVGSSYLKKAVSKFHVTNFILADGSPIKQSNEVDKLLNLLNVDGGSFKINGSDSSYLSEPAESDGGTDADEVHDTHPTDLKPTVTENSPMVASMLSTEFKLTEGMKRVGHATISAVEGIANEGFKSAELATQGALRSIFEVTRTLELLTVGAYYKTSSTAFVTFKSRVSACSSYQMLLSHDHYTIEVKPAPNPKDIIWENVSVPQRQITWRKAIATCMIFLGAIFWSIAVSFITAISNLDSFSENFPIIKRYSSTAVYRFLNNYMAIGLLLMLLNSLPLIFDFISRRYERIKLESEIQNLIMDRYFKYQLANVFVAVQIGTIAIRLNEVLSNPSCIASILGSSLPAVSIYFMNMMVIKTFTAVPCEMLRLYPLLKLLEVKLFYDERKFTEIELHSGVFADPQILYGWVYPNLLMVMMIMATYSCIAPLIIPCCVLYYGMAYQMYKYQLLYVYMNNYQSGGFMWYAVFTRSMVGLIFGICTLLCYLAVRGKNFDGPFYVLLPLPLIVGLFWYLCESKHKNPSMNLSLQSAIQIDRCAKVKTANSRRSISKYNPIYSFKPTLFRQPSLTEEWVDLPSLDGDGLSPPCTLENSSYDTMESQSASQDGELSNRWSHVIELSPVHEMGSLSLSPVTGATSHQPQSGPLRSPPVNSMPSQPYGERPWTFNEDTVNFRRASYFSPTAANIASRDHDRRDVFSTAMPLPENITTRKSTPRHHHHHQIHHQGQGQGQYFKQEEGDGADRRLSLTDYARLGRPFVYELDEAIPMLASSGSDQKCDREYGSTEWRK